MTIFFLNADTSLFMDLYIHIFLIILKYIFNLFYSNNRCYIAWIREISFISKSESHCSPGIIIFSFRSSFYEGLKVASLKLNFFFFFLFGFVRVFLPQFQIFALRSSLLPGFFSEATRNLSHCNPVIIYRLTESPKVVKVVDQPVANVNFSCGLLSSRVKYW